MMPSMNPSQMKKMMQRMGIAQTEIDAEQVIIRTKVEEIIITDPSVIKVNMMGQETFQISGKISKRAREIELNEEDIKTVMEQAGVDREIALEGLKKNEYDLAKTILSLSSK